MRINLNSRHAYALGFVIALGLMANAAYLQAKAWLAQGLIMHSWQQALETGADVRPWPWADTWPVSRILMPQHKIDLIVLAGDDGRTLAFGPGARLSVPLPGENGVSMISAHRDTYFEFLERVRVGEQFIIQNRHGDLLHYRIRDLRVIDQPRMIMPSTSAKSAVIFITCYPFHALVAGGPQRFVVVAEQVDTFGV